MASISNSSNAPLEDSLFRYRPIGSLDEIRMLRILPGDPEDAIHLELAHYPLAEMPTCDALSYVWGPEGRVQQVICDKRIIKVTPNLVAVLKRLRSQALSPAAGDQNAAGHLWIDGISINQDDIKERSQQVKLMTEIYTNAKQVVVWIGEEANEEMSKRAFQILHQLDRTCRTLELQQQGVRIELNEIPDSAELEDGTQIQQLTQDPAWPTVVDLLASRVYFTRLWTVQEIVLAKADRTIVMCGGNWLQWGVFQNAARVLQVCQALRLTIDVNNLALLNGIVDLKEMQMAFHEQALTLINCLGRIEEQQHAVSQVHDRVFGFSGMLQNHTRKALSLLDYKMPVNEVFQTATVVMILESQLLYHFIWRDVACTSSETPTWIAFNDFRPQYRFTLQLQTVGALRDYSIHFETDKGVFTKAQVLSGVPISLGEISPVLNAEGFFIDEVTTSSQNFSKDNFLPEIASMYQKLRDNPANSLGGPDALLDSLWLCLSLHDARFETQDQYSRHRMSFNICFSRWVLLQFENEVDFKLGKHTFKQEELDFFVSQAELGVGALAREVLEKYHLYRENLEVVKHYGRNIFFGAKGHIGTGPMGDNRLELTAAAVRVGDKIGCLAGLDRPVILRPDSGGLYQFIGPAFIPHLSDDPCLQAEDMPNLERIRIC